MKFPKPVHKPKVKKKLRKISDSRMTTKLDNLVRLIFKKKYEPVCYVCGASTGWFSNENKYGIQVGHYIGRGVYLLRWDFHNLFPQCSSCNARHEDNPTPFYEAIIRKEGKARIDYLNAKYKEHLSGKTLVKLKEKQELFETLTVVLNSC